MKTKFFTVNYIAQEIRGSERAFNRAGRGYEAEQTELTTLMNNNHGFKLVITESEKKKTTYEGLNYSFVEEYIALNDPDRMPELKAFKKNKTKFSTIKKWFLGIYKKDGEEFNVNKELKKIREAKTNSEIETARKATVVDFDSASKSKKESA